jgi:hypothetical protein
MCLAHSDDLQVPQLQDVAAQTEKLQQMVNEARNSTLVFQGPFEYKIKSGLKFPKDTALEFHNGAKLAPARGVTIEIEGSVQAGLWRIFAGEGQVHLGPGAAAQVYPQWWGAWNDGTHTPETTAAMQAALDSGHKVFVPPGTYLCRALNVHVRGTVLQGANRETSVLKYDSIHGSFVTLSEPFMKVADLAVLGSAPNSAATSVGVHLSGGSRSKLENVRIGGFAYGVQVSKLGGNNIDHCYIYQNRRAGIYLSDGAHGVSVTNGTEIADVPFGIMLGRFRDHPWSLDESFTGVTGQMVSVRGAVIEGIHAVDGPGCKKCFGGVGIYSGMGQKAIAVTDTYFEDMQVALQLGHGLKKHSTAAINAVFKDNFLSDVVSAVKVGRVYHGDISNNHCATVKHMFETSEASLFEDVKVERNFGYDKLTSHPFSADFGK